MTVFFVTLLAIGFAVAASKTLIFVMGNGCDGKKPDEIFRFDYC
jgi:hypothetical protein